MRTGLGGALDNRLEFDLSIVAFIPFVIIIDVLIIIIVFLFITFVFIVLFVTFIVIVVLFIIFIIIIVLFITTVSSCSLPCRVEVTSVKMSIGSQLDQVRGGGGVPHLQIRL